MPNTVRVQESASSGVATKGHAPAPDDAVPSVRPSAKRFELRPPSSSGYCSDPYLRKSARQVPSKRVPDAKGFKGRPHFMDKVRVRVCLSWTPPPLPHTCLLVGAHASWRTHASRGRRRPPWRALF